MDRLYEFRYEYHFSDKEIDQIIVLVKAWICHQKVDLRHCTLQVRKYARAVYLLDRWDTYEEKLAFNRCFDIEWDTPAEVLWRMVKPMIVDHSGFSINRDKRWWFDLNMGYIRPSEKDFDSRTIADHERVLCKLDFEGYINFQAAGSIWRIEIKTEYAVESAK